MKSRLFIFITGILTGIMLILASAAWFIINAPALLVVDDKPHKVDLAVVLGGGGGSRFQKGLSIYNAGLVDRLLLVDYKKDYWDWMLQRFCPDCQIEGTEKRLVILEGSKSTLTDAKFVDQYCSKHGIDSILVITDPYHTRRASILFNMQFAQQHVEVLIVSSGFYGSRLSPGEKWWQDNSTLKIIFNEISKIAIIFFRKFASDNEDQ